MALRRTMARQCRSLEVRTHSGHRRLMWSQVKYCKIVSVIPSRLAPILNTNTRLLMQRRWPASHFGTSRSTPDAIDGGPNSIIAEIIEVVVGANGSQTRATASLTPLR